MPKSAARKKEVEAKQDSKDLLLDAAIGLIWQSNYHNVGVNEICTTAGVTKGCFYHYFDSKATLYEAAAERYWQMMRADMDAIFSPSKKPLEQLGDMLKYIVQKQEWEEEIGDRNPVSGCPFFTAGAQSGEGEERVQKVAREMSDKVGHYGTALVSNLANGGFLNSNSNPEKIGRMVSQFIQGLLLYGRVYSSLEIVKEDLPEGVYRLLDLKPEYRKTNVLA